MAIKEFVYTETTKMNIIMKDGREFLGCDLVTQGANQTILAFWYENAVRMVPLQDILMVDMYNEQN